jgi:hypothetical protein
LKTAPKAELTTPIIVKDIETPSTIARGRNLFFPADVARTAGKRGRIQGDRTLRIPAPNAATGEIASGYMFLIHFIVYF